MHRDDARRVMNLLAAAYPTYPVEDDTLVLYLSAMTQQMPDAATAMAVAVDWTTRESHFPKIAELLDAYQAEAGKRERYARSRRIAQEHYVEGVVACSTCGDTGMELWTDDRGYEFAAPCSVCRPADRAYWRDGHYDGRHEVSSCEHQRCVRRYDAAAGHR